MTLVLLSACGGGGDTGKDLGNFDDNPDNSCTLTSCDDGEDDGDDGNGDGGDGEGDGEVASSLDFSNLGLTDFSTLGVSNTRAFELIFSGNEFENLGTMVGNVYSGVTEVVFNNNSVFLGLDELANFIDLERIEGNTFDSGLCSLTDLANLRILTLPDYAINLDVPVNGEDISCIQRMPALEELNLFGANIVSGTDIGFLDNLTNLTVLDTRTVEFSGVNENTLNKSSMSYIDLNGSTSDVPISLDALNQSYNTLETLDLKTVTIEDAHLLANFSALTYLALTLSNEYVLDETGGVDLSELYRDLFAGSTNLAHLDLSDSGNIAAPSIFRNFSSARILNF